MPPGCPAVRADRTLLEAILFNATQNAALHGAAQHPIAVRCSVDEAGATSALGEAKRVVYNGIDATLETAGEFEATMITKAMASADGLEGVAAFVEKRAPEFE